MNLSKQHYKRIAECFEEIVTLLSSSDHPDDKALADKYRVKYRWYAQKAKP